MVVIRPSVDYSFFVLLKARCCHLLSQLRHLGKHQNGSPGETMGLKRLQWCLLRSGAFLLICPVISHPSELTDIDPSPRSRITRNA
jgi:hypothetical protein